jgi:hypothetical protein
MHLSDANVVTWRRTCRCSAPGDPRNSLPKPMKQFHQTCCSKRAGPPNPLITARLATHLCALLLSAAAAAASTDHCHSTSTTAGVQRPVNAASRAEGRIVQRCFSGKREQDRECLEWTDTDCASLQVMPVLRYPYRPDIALTLPTSANC